MGSGGWSYRATLCGSDHLPGRASGSLDPVVDVARIRAIYVHPSWARRGLGSLILAHCDRLSDFLKERSILIELLEFLCCCG